MLLPTTTFSSTSYTLPLTTMSTAHTPPTTVQLICTIIYLPVLLNHRSDAIISSPYLELNGLDCSSPSHTRYTSLSSVCNAGANNQAPTTQSVLIVQTDREHVVAGYRCTRRESVFTDVCAVWGHLKRYGPPTIDHPAVMDPQTCHRLVTTAVYKKEDGLEIDVPMNTRQTYTVVRHGHLYLTANDVSCRGATITINGETVNGVVESVSVTITVTEIKIEISDNTLTDLDNNTPMPLSCLNAGGCRAGSMTYVLPASRNTCPLYTVRVLQMYATQIKLEEGDQQGFVNHEHKLLFIAGRDEPSPPGCDATFTMTATQYPHLKLVLDEQDELTTQKIAGILPPSSLNLDLEIRASEEYVSFRFERLITQRLGDMGTRLCRMSAATLAHTELSPFSSNAVLRVRGDVIQELQCRRLIVTARLGDKRGKTCSTAALPVWLHNQPVYLQAGDHMIIHKAEIEHVDCRSFFPPYFTTITGEILTADPVVRRVDVKLEPLPALGDGGITHEKFSQDLIYTSEEVNRFNQLIHFSRTKKRVLDALTNKYCEDTESCGQFSPARGTSSFSLSNLEHHLTNPISSLFRSFTDKLQAFGAYCSILIALYLFILMAYKIGRVVYFVKLKTINVTEALRLSFLPAHTYAANAAALRRRHEDDELALQRLTFTPPPPREDGHLNRSDPALPTYLKCNSTETSTDTMPLSK